MNSLLVPWPSTVVMKDGLSPKSFAPATLDPIPSAQVLRLLQHPTGDGVKVEAAEPFENHSTLFSRGKG